MRPLLILLLVGLPVFAQVILPARRIVPSAPAAETWSNIDCGSPPVFTNLVAWWCFQALRTQVPGITNQQTFTALADIGPRLTNGIYYTAAVGSPTTQPKYNTNDSTYNFRDTGQFGNTSAHSVMTQSNAWWTGLTEAEIVWVIRPGNQSEISWSGMTGNRTRRSMIKDSSGNSPSSFGTLSTNNPGNLNINFAAATAFFRINVYTANNDFGIYTNGVLAWSTNVNTVSWPATAALGFVTGNAPVYATFNNKLFEVLVFANKLTTDQRNAIDDWLATKYNMP